MKPNYLSFGNRSKHLLAVTKAKAKMVEFSISEQPIETPIAPQKLLTLTIGILGELSSLISRGIENTDRIDHLKSELKKTAQYFDALNQTELEPELKDYLNLLGASAYYLLDMPGNTMVLINKIKGVELKDGDLAHYLKLTPSGIEDVLVWLLKHHRKDYCDYKYWPSWCIDDTNNDKNITDQSLAIRKELCYVLNEFYSYYNNGNDNNFYCELNSLVEIINRLGDDRELLFSYILIAALKKKLKNSSVANLPKYTGLALDLWVPILKKRSFIKEFWPAQKILGEYGVFRGKSAVIQLPTGAGKTKSTEIIIRSAFLSDRADIAVVIAPFRSLVNEISEDFRGAFKGESNISVNQLSDIPQVSVEENKILINLFGPLAKELIKEIHTKTIIITTPEKFLYLLRQKPELKDKINLVILDEGHQFDSGSRGVTYELLLTELKMSIASTAQFVLISAVISNAEQIGRWLYGDDGKAIHSLENLSTSKSVAYTSWQTELGQLHYVDSDLDERDYFVPRLIKKMPLELRGRETAERFFPEEEPNDIASYLGILLCQQYPTAIFCGQAQTVRGVCEVILNAYQRKYSYMLPPVMSGADQIELDKIYNLTQLHVGAQHSFSEAIKLGVLPHGASVPNGIRVASEWAIANKKARLIVCTSTLAQGVNLPLKYLVVSNIYQGKEQISTRDFQNLVGRVGRSGYFTEGDIIFADTKVFEGRHTYNQQWRWHRVNGLLSKNNSEACISSLKKIIEPIPYLHDRLQDEWVLELCEDTESFEQIVNDLLEEFRIHPENFGISGKDVTETLKKIEYDWGLKKQIVNAIENFMIAYLNDNKDAQLLDLINLAENTLAYFLIGDERERELFQKVFCILANRVHELDDLSKMFFCKTLLGINELKKIKNYLLDEADLLQFDEISLLKEIWPFIISLTQGKLIHKIPLEATYNIANLWINGESLLQIDKVIIEKKYKYQRGKKQSGTIYIEQLMDLTSHDFGHNLSMIIGAMADICDGIDRLRDCSEMFRNLQSMMRVGLPDKLTLFLYNKGYVDREICKLIAEGLEKHGVDRNNFLSNVVIENKDVVSNSLKNYPSYFQNI